MHCAFYLVRVCVNIRYVRPPSSPLAENEETAAFQPEPIEDAPGFSAKGKL
jgi:hypothetical protein